MPHESGSETGIPTRPRSESTEPAVRSLSAALACSAPQRPTSVDRQSRAGTSPSPQARTGSAADRHPQNPALREIGDVSAELGIPQHVLRYWEEKFPALKPRRLGGGRRRYSAKDVALIQGIKHLLHDRHLTIDGAQKALRRHGVDAIRRPGAVPMETELRQRLQKLRNDLLAARAGLADH